MRPGRKTYLKKEVIHVKEEAANDASGEGQKWRFVRKLNSVFINHRLYVPKELAKGSGLAKRKEVEVENEEGRGWRVAITSGNGEYCLCRGWRDFLGANGVKPDSILVFEYVRGVMKVAVAEKEEGEAMLARAPRGGLLPFL